MAKKTNTQTVKAYDGTADRQKVEDFMHKAATRMREFALDYNHALKDMGETFGVHTPADLEAGAKPLLHKAAEYTATLPKFLAPVALESLTREIMRLRGLWAAINIGFPSHLRIPTTVARVPMDLLDISPDGTVTVKPIPADPFDIYVDAEVYDQFIELITVQRGLYERYGKQMGVIIDTLMEPADMSRMKPKNPRFEAAGLSRLARAGLL